MRSEDFTKGYTRMKDWYGDPDWREPCLWDSLSPEERKEPQGFSCNCSRCSPRC